MNQAAWLLLLALGLPAQQRLLATHYFYWYRWPDAHFNEPGARGPEGHLHHFPAPEEVSWRSAAWHEQQFRAMAGCGIDVALPVYWGFPEVETITPHLAFAHEGLPPMVEALRKLEAAGERGVRLGLFFDTSSLQNDLRRVEPKGGKPDLTTSSGKQLFTRTIEEFFARVPRTFWAHHRGGALCVLYAAGFAAKWDVTLGPTAKQAFAARFPGESLCLVADQSWGQIGQDLTTRWGGALFGPVTLPHVAQIGPGYDDSPVPGRTTPFRDREDGRFYEYSWREALKTRPELVLLETWNEMHEGTEICATKETGTRYLELTRHWNQLWRADAELPPAVTLRWPFMRQRRDDSWGSEVKAAPGVSLDFTPAEPVRSGLREVAWEDGRFELAGGVLVARRTQAVGYVYFQVADAWRFEQEGEFELSVELVHAGAIELEYDSTRREATQAGAYTRTWPLRRDGGRLVFALPKAFFGNRQNGRADFRLVTHGELRLRKLSLRATD